MAIGIMLESVQVSIARVPTGPVILQFVDAQSGIAITVPMDPATAKNVGMQLSTSVFVASSPLPTGQMTDPITGRPIPARGSTDSG